MTRKRERTEDEQAPAPLVEVFTEAEMYSFTGQAEGRARWSEAKARALITLGNEFYEEQQAIRGVQNRMRAAKSKEKPPELSPAMHLASVEAFKASALFEVASALHRIAERLPRPLAGLALLLLLLGACKPCPPPARDMGAPAADLRSSAPDLGPCDVCDQKDGGAGCTPSRCVRRADGQFCCVK